MSQQAIRSSVVIARHSPYGGGPARAGLDTALAMAAFSQPVRLLFLGAGVLQLLPDQDAAPLGLKTLGRQLASLPLYDLSAVFADAAAARRHGVDLTRAPLAVTALDANGIQDLLKDCDHLLGF